MENIVSKLVEKYGKEYENDIKLGVAACKKVWAKTEVEFKKFCLDHYLPTKEEKIDLMDRVINFDHTLGGGMLVAYKTARIPMDVDNGKDITNIDKFMAKLSPISELNEYYHKTNFSALIQLNFGHRFTDELPKNIEEWKMYRTSFIGYPYIPSDLSTKMSKIMVESDHFSNSYLIDCSRIDFEDKDIVFDKSVILMPHWHIRDYAMSLNGKEFAVKKQKALFNLWERVVKGEIPKEFISNKEAIWKIKQDVLLIDGKEKSIDWMNSKRWENFCQIIKLRKSELDKHYNVNDFIEHRFKEVMEVEMDKVESILDKILSSDNGFGIVKYLEKKYGRKIESFDLFNTMEEEANADVKIDPDELNKYNTAEKLHAAIPGILMKLGFSNEDSNYIASKIVVDQSRAAGHASPASTTYDMQKLRVKFDPENFRRMDFSVFMHELGHCTEGVISRFMNPNKILWGIPNTAFTEAFAFYFQGKTDFILTGEDESNDFESISRFWMTYNLAAHAMFEIQFYKWLYKEDKLTADKIQEKTVEIASDLWKKYIERFLGESSEGILAGYTHILMGILYLPDYPMGRVIEYQITKFLKNKPLAENMLRMCKIGSIKPNEWMKQAINEELSADHLVEDCENALKKLNLL